MIDKEARTLFIYFLCEKYTKLLLETGKEGNHLRRYRCLRFDYEKQGTAP